MKYPSFNPDAPQDLQLSQELQDTKASVLDATRELEELLLGPRMLMFIHHRMPFFVYGVIGRFGLANKVPIEGEISYADLATATGVNEASLTHILRYAISFRVFQERHSGYISHSASSRVPAENPGLQDSFDMMREELLAPSFRVADALEKWPSADEPGETAYLLSENSDQPTFFAQLAQNPERERRFATSMKMFTRLDDVGAQYPWDHFGPGTIVDVGGSAGEAVFSIARKFPDLKLVVQDLPEVVAPAKEQEGLSVTFMAYDFFEPQPVTADAYIFRRIFHSWSDKHSVRILRNMIPALKSGARLLIIDIVAAPFGVLPNRVQREVCHMDMVMHITHNSKERNLEEWKNMLAAADARFHVQEVRQTKESILAILDIVWKSCSYQLDKARRRVCDQLFSTAPKVLLLLLCFTTMASGYIMRLFTL